MQKRVLVLLFSLCLFPVLPASAVDVDETAPDLTLPLLMGEGDASLSDYEGKIVYLDFWASWCPPCLVSMPLMNDLRNRLREQGIEFEVVAINVDSAPEDGKDFLLDRPVDFVVLQDPEGETPAQYEIKGMPTSFLIGPDGVVHMRHEGFKRSDADMIEAEIMSLAGQ